MPTSQILLTNHSPPKFLKEDEVSQECKDLISSLPKRRGWVVPRIFNYQGFWHTSRHLQGVLAFQTRFESQNDDILLITSPKSGTTWLKALVFSIVNRHLYPKNKDHPLLTSNPHFLVPFLEIKVFLENDSPLLSSYKSPRLFATHLPLVSLPQNVKKSSCKLVYLCRNAKDTFVSLWQFTNKLRGPNDLGSNSIEEMLGLFCEGVSIYGPFWDHVKAYYDESIKNPDKILFLKYEEITKEPKTHLKKLAEFLGCSFSLDEEKDGVVDSIIELCSFGNLSNLEVNKSGKLSSGEEHKAFFRRGEIGDWKNHLTQDMADRLDEISAQKLKGCGLEL